MPHIPPIEKIQVTETGKAESVGQLCWLFADKALDQWNTNPRWATVHAIKRALKNPYHTEWSHEVVMKYANTFDRQDIETAAELAFFELYRLVFSVYEDTKIAENGSAFTKGITFPVEKVFDAPIADHSIEACVPACFDATQAIVVPAKKRGRPVGSKNKVHTEVA